MEKTKDYSKFKIRLDNREKGIDRNNLKRLIDSIRKNNLLELRPININNNWEVIDGMHRLEAARQLGLEIYYNKTDDISHEDMLLLNVGKTWGLGDYLNYFCYHGFQEYIKLREFINRHDIGVKTGLVLTMRRDKKSFTGYKEGGYKFTDDEIDSKVDLVWESIEYINKSKGYCNYTNSGRFWAAICRLFAIGNFDEAIWKRNLYKLVERIGPRANIKDYFTLFVGIYNWKNTEKLNLDYKEIE
jgi:hypothetical protein